MQIHVRKHYMYIFMYMYMYMCIYCREPVNQYILARIDTISGHSNLQ